ncbi:MAG: ABC transporter substrate-binding protein [Cyanobacteria bacterium P01_F01_bin.150]
MSLYSSPLSSPIVKRRRFLQLSGLFATSFSVSTLMGSCSPPLAQSSDGPPVRTGYLPITDAAALLAAYDRGFYEAEGLDAKEPQRFRSWDAIANAFINRTVNVVHLLMPTTVWLRYAQKLPGKVVAWNHTNGSAITVLPDINKPEDLAGRDVAVPFWYSIHNIVLQMLLRQHGLEAVLKPSGTPLADHEVRLVVLPPPDMLAALQNGDIAGYIVAEPYNSAAELTQSGKLLRLTGDVWKDHACCVVFMHEDDIVERPTWTQAVVNAIVKAQQWAKANRPELAYILSKDGGQYMPYELPVLERVMTYYDNDYYYQKGAIINPEWRSRRIDFQPYPFPSYTAALVSELQKTLIGGPSDFLQPLVPEQVARDLVDDSFVKKALAYVGGPQAFGLALDLSRQERILL